ncbi:hypothetical protein KOM00_04025 [Geomonas sp. Red69]|uniref:TraB/GumN family protein n=1 Tax=Geomonas diazotrophica TaxID=2843197 RepID=A0ABX8JIG4_9BACT|nr:MULTISPECIES: hypothetical protein [Geomonas]MBU5635893.1 hypothetical protein [Geomonas diazotrophica]QWV96911.1 hypothetical protein KP005_16395 [Geomonas nitrogeniifigens]QXE86087.1 hypothetical protein KP003_17245 [Geomonas nitrogeniifigens]
MNLAKTLLRFCCVLSVVASLSGMRPALAADDNPTGDLTKELKEMPVLTGETWQALQPDAKITFIWGIGHVVTIEENVIQRHPELKRQGFVAKLAEGLRGVPMETIIQDIDSYYRNNPDDRDIPVMRVIWTQIVKPKLKLGIADRPFAGPGGP